MFLTGKRRLPLLATLRGRLVLLACLVTLPTLLFTVYVANKERSAVLKRMAEDASHLARLASREHGHQIGGARSLLRWIADRFIQDGDHAVVMTDEGFLAALLAGYPQLANIGMLSAEGKVLRSAYPLPNFPNMADNPAFVRAKRSNEVEAGTYIIGPIVGRPVLNLAYAIRRPGDSIRRVAFVALDLRWLEDLAKQVNLPPEYSLLVADRDGRVLAHSGAAIRASATGMGKLIPGLADLPNQRGGKILKVSDDQPPQFFVGERIEEIPSISVAVGLPYEHIYREANLAFYRTLGGLALLTLITVVLVLLTTELSILRALRTLSSTAQRFGRGELSARAVIDHGHGELRELATEFNSMADALAARHGELTEAHKRLLALSQHLQVVRETEARHIARELHDEIGQVLTSLKMDVSSLQRRYLREAASSPETASFERDVAEMSRRLDLAVEFVRRISSELRPTVLDRLGLAAAIEWQAREVEARANLTVEVDCSGVEEPLDWLVSITIFRIIQETLTNVVRHAEATMVCVALLGTADELTLSVSDDGKGIDDATIHRVDSIGIIGMKERAHLVDGEFKIRGEAGKGTLVTVKIPRKRAQEGIHAHPVG